MIFHRSRIKPNVINKVVIDNHDLTQVRSAKYHGVIIDHKLNWIEHISYVTKCTRGDARVFFCTYKMYLYVQNYFLKNIFKYCFKSYIKLHEYANCNSANYDV